MHRATTVLIASTSLSSCMEVIKELYHFKGLEYLTISFLYKLITLESNEEIDKRYDEIIYKGEIKVVNMGKSQPH